MDVTNLVLLISSAECKPLSYDTCREFAIQFDRLYDGRNDTDYPHQNPMLRTSSTTLDYDATDKEVFDSIQFPIEYNFPQDGDTGVFDRTFKQDAFNGGPTVHDKVDLCGTYALKQSDYRGTIAETESGTPCQAWSSQSPHTHDETPSNYPNSGLESNYCRNPDPENWSRAWCYTTMATRWEYCSVPSCGSISGWNLHDKVFALVNPNTGHALSLSGSVQNGICANNRIVQQEYTASNSRQQFKLNNEDQLESVSCPEKVITASGVCNGGAGLTLSASDPASQAQKWRFYDDGLVNLECGRMNGNLAITEIKDNSFDGIPRLDDIRFSLVNPSTGKAISVGAPGAEVSCC